MTMTEQQSPSISPVEDVQRDLAALRNDVSRLSQEVTRYVSASGRKAVREPTSGSMLPFVSVHSSLWGSPWVSGLFSVSCFGVVARAHDLSPALTWPGRGAGRADRLRSG